ncbi:tetrahydromethanopterin S-methyltransferase subunit E [Methanimicrococcus blatticola]|uniref:Tetrahydromethanopterin S-methyltransferase subunit E n=1 Tax=Methanimicrococcus blatticola TaxID=91560 RepID=A0A484F7A1_9EURY|nr:tetrahydromethanopterin S-methyltransferase subunit E [Methanimicrococcus blatticola]MBZ3936111.1 tetrahydromethanopterin S-methyltransferase subunit E [Methanimicrococcus blatticola]MCC2508354.1 tetrahydromethanopterin S-methyltransferase subunit E [Methanimicrococcus blatticola]TDQ70193.1 tetrahydromethanopterin S-methyltransferase subunit E [Methanimicrococcus blatticola]
MDPLIGMGVLALVGAVAAIAGYTEDLESVVGSQSNPNSQVQLAPQMKYPHRLFNKAISGEPLSNGLAAVIGAVIAVSLESFYDLSIITVIVIGSVAAMMIHMILATTSFFGRISSQSRFKQPIYLDVFKTNLPVIAAYAFMTTACILIICYLMTSYLEIWIPIPLLALILGITVGSIGSSVGDIQYGAERLYQNLEFGSGINAAYSGNIVRKAESGIRSGVDNSWFSSKFGGPTTGIAFAAVLFMTSWITVLFNPEWGNAVGWIGLIAGVLFILATILINRFLEKSARRNFGPYREEEKTEIVE